MFILNLIFLQWKVIIMLRPNPSCSLILCYLLHFVHKAMTKRAIWKSELLFLKSMASLPQFVFATHALKKSISTKFKVLFPLISYSSFGFIFHRTLRLRYWNWKMRHFLSVFACVLRVIININYTVDDGQKKRSVTNDCKSKAKPGGPAVASHVKMGQPLKWTLHVTYGNFTTHTRSTLYIVYLFYSPFSTWWSRLFFLRLSSSFIVICLLL